MFLCSRNSRGLNGQIFFIFILCIGHVINFSFFISAVFLQFVKLCICEVHNNSLLHLFINIANIGNEIVFRYLGISP